MKGATLLTNPVQLYILTATFNPRATNPHPELRIIFGDSVESL